MHTVESLSYLITACGDLQVTVMYLYFFKNYTNEDLIYNLLIAGEVCTMAGSHVQRS